MWVLSITISSARMPPGVGRGFGGGSRRHLRTTHVLWMLELPANLIDTPAAIRVHPKWKWASKGEAPRRLSQYPLSNVALLPELHCVPETTEASEATAFRRGGVIADTAGLVRGPTDDHRTISAQRLRAVSHHHRRRVTTTRGADPATNSDVAIATVATVGHGRPFARQHPRDGVALEGPEGDAELRRLGPPPPLGEARLEAGVISRRTRRTLPRSPAVL